MQLTGTTSMEHLMYKENALDAIFTRKSVGCNIVSITMVDELMVGDAVNFQKKSPLMSCLLGHLSVNVFWFK